MSKIPRGEWSAITARYAKGESITRIAQSYGCTPPAIHYILKEVRQRATHNLEQPLNGRSETPQALTPQLTQTPAASSIPHAIDSRHEARDATRSAADKSTPSAAAPSAPRVVIDRLAATVTATLRDVNQPTVPQVQPGRARNTGGGSALTARLDRELRSRAEAASEAFRSSFNAALTEDSLVVRQCLRQAASELMRLAARTIIVLDRVNAGTERPSKQVGDHLRSTNAPGRI
jgi:transposase-like protein